MLSRFIVDLYTWIIEIFLWFMLLVSAAVGWRFTLPFLRGIGLIPGNEGAAMIAGALLAVVVTFLGLAIALGPLLVLFEIRRSVKVLEAKRAGDGIGVLHTERADPPLGMPREFRLR
jgi:hypothetical protein